MSSVVSFSSLVATVTAAVLAIPSPALGTKSLQAQEQEEDPPVTLDGLIVTATRGSAPEWTIASHTTVVGRAELERTGVKYVADALRKVPGLAVVRNGSFGAVTSVFLRGGEADYIQVLVDGVPVNEPGGRFDFGSMSTDNIERIEIVRGPSSDLYGSDAVSGVIHILTRRGTGAPAAELSLHAGSFGTQQWRASLAGGDDRRVSYAFSWGRSTTDGILAYNNQHLLTTVTGRVHIRPDPRSDAVLSVRHEDRRFHYPTDGTGALADRNAFAFGDALALAIDAGRRWTPSLRTRVSLALNESDGGTDDRPDGPADSLGFFGFNSLDDIRRATADLRAVWQFAGESSLAVGAEFERQSLRSFSESLSQYGSLSGNSENERRNRAAYAQLAWVRGGLALTGGARAEDNERFGTAATWRAGVAWRAESTGTRLRGSAGTGIKEPSFLESFATGYAIGNPNLEPERSTGLEAGVDQAIGGGKAKLSMTGFWQRYRNLIQYTPTPPAANGPNYYNVARARSRGIEAEGTAEAGPARLATSYAWVDTQVEDAGFDDGPGASFVKGQPLVRRPRHTIAASATISAGRRAAFDLAVRRTGEREDRDFGSWPASPVTLPAHTVVDLAANVRLASDEAGRPTVTLVVRAENLFNETYEEVWGFSAPGRGVYIGGKVALGGGSRP